MKRTLDTSKSAPHYSAECDSCGWWADGAGDTQRKARAHTRSTGHATRCETTLVLHYRLPASSTKETGG